MSADRRPTRSAVVGCGDVSVVHLAALDAMPDVELVAVVDSDPARAEAAASRWGVPSFPDHRTMLEAARPDVVHVCTPHDQHVDVAADCLEAGIAVVVEKPLAHSMAEAERLASVAEAHPDTKIAVCYQNRYNATAEALRALVDSGDLGRVAGASATVCWHRTPAYYEAGPWRGRRVRSGGGVLINQAIHTLDLVQWLVGPVTRVSGHAGTYALADVIDVEDTADLVLEHAGGARSVFFATTANAVDAPVTVDLYAEHATAHLRNDLTITWADGRTETVAERTAGGPGRGYWGVSHGLLIADFYAQLDSPDRFWIGPREALESLRIIMELYAASS
jgi:UDP-N-acetyl-2-amino-2-deoxyglucuronate dehydrogenase